MSGGPRANAGGPRVGAGRPRKHPVRATPAEVPAIAEAMPEVLDADLMPLDYMLKVIRDPTTDESRRDRLAVAAAPYCHPKMGEAGKKEQKQRDADRVATGKFAPAPPPKLVVSNGK